MKVANTKAKIDDKLSNVKVSIDAEGWIRIKWIYNGHDDAGTTKPVADNTENQPAEEDESSKDEEKNNQNQATGGSEEVKSSSSQHFYFSTIVLLLFSETRKQSWQWSSESRTERNTHYSSKYSSKRSVYDSKYKIEVPG